MSQDIKEQVRGCSAYRLGVHNRPVLAAEARLSYSCNPACCDVFLHLLTPLSIQDQCPLSLVPLPPVPSLETSPTGAASLTISADPLS